MHMRWTVDIGSRPVIQESDGRRDATHERYGLSMPATQARYRCTRENPSPEEQEDKSTVGSRLRGEAQERASGTSQGPNKTEIITIRMIE